MIEHVALDAGFYSESEQKMRVHMNAGNFIEIPERYDISGIEDAVREARDRLEEMRNQYNPCPMCGSRPHITVSDYRRKQHMARVRVECRECQLEIWGKHEELVEKWNRMGVRE